ncbi:chitin synthase-domain-containing protein [Mycena galericulata]|nr:chitin synthase-domain-containing protein [Mycena galericulata]
MPPLPRLCYLVASVSVFYGPYAVQLTRIPPVFHFFLFENAMNRQSTLHPRMKALPNQLEGRSVKGQVRSTGLAAAARRCATVFEVGMAVSEFCERYGAGMTEAGVVEGDERERVEQARTAYGMGERDIVLGVHKVYLSQRAFHRLEDELHATDTKEQKRNRMRDAEVEGGLGVYNDPDAPYSSPQLEGVGRRRGPWRALRRLLAVLYERDKHKALHGPDSDFDARSQFTSAVDADSASNFRSESYAPSRNMFGAGAAKGTASLLAKDALAGEIQEGETVEVMKESSARRRWVTLCWLLTWWVPNPCLSYVGCMKRLDVRQAWREKLAINLMIWFVSSELAGHNFQNDAINRIVTVVPSKTILKTYGGTASDNIFPVQVSALCNSVDGGVSPYVVFSSSNNTDPNTQYHDFRFFTNDSWPDWYFESMVQMCWTARVGFVGLTPKEIRTKANNRSSIGIYNGLVYDLTSYMQNPRDVAAPTGTVTPQVDNNFMSNQVVDIFKLNAGGDVTKKIDNFPLMSDQLTRQKVCMRNLFTVGRVDSRDSVKCISSTYLLLILSIIMVSVIGFKFLASISLAGVRAPEDHDKFVICQLKYDDKRKLLLIICDSMIVGSGNDRPTLHIVLDIFGADPNLDPEPLTFLSLGEGAKQHNMGKVYSGIYECNGHVVPYLVITKATERSRPGNRSKRDSQMLLMHFLNKLEMYHQIKNVIGVNPRSTSMCSWWTPTSHLLIHDKKLLGICGSPTPSSQSLTMMMQVYKYFISHNIAKAFDSLFGSVTCLPGCFTLCRLPTPDTHMSLLIPNQLVAEYAENRVDTVHVKNLLHLREDWYPHNTPPQALPAQFVRDAHAYTVAPDDWKILLSLRRCWINSTVHNLCELVFLEQLCGFCCFSMRFVVMIDSIARAPEGDFCCYIHRTCNGKGYLATGKVFAARISSSIAIAINVGLPTSDLDSSRRFAFADDATCQFLTVILHPENLEFTIGPGRHIGQPRRREEGMAKLWTRPCVFMSENNKFGTGTSAEHSSSNTEYFTCAGAKIPGVQMDGMDIKSPLLLLEFDTYHYIGYLMSDRHDLPHARGGPAHAGPRVTATLADGRTISATYVADTTTGLPSPWPMSSSPPPPSLPTSAPSSTSPKPVPGAASANLVYPPEPAPHCLSALGVWRAAYDGYAPALRDYDTSTSCQKISRPHLADICAILAILVAFLLSCSGQLPPHQAQAPPTAWTNEAVAGLSSRRSSSNPRPPHTATVGATLTLPKIFYCHDEEAKHIVNAIKLSRSMQDLLPGGAILEGAEEGTVGAGSLSGATTAVAGEFHAALDTLFATGVWGGGSGRLCWASTSRKRSSAASRTSSGAADTKEQKCMGYAMPRSRAGSGSTTNRTGRTPASSSRARAFRRRPVVATGTVGPSAVPVASLVAHASQLQRAELDKRKDNGYKELHGADSDFESESYAPGQNMLGAGYQECGAATSQDALVAEIRENEEVINDNSAWHEAARCAAGVA